MAVSGLAKVHLDSHKIQILLLSKKEAPKLGIQTWYLNCQKEILKKNQEQLWEKKDMKAKEEFQNLPPQSKEAGLGMFLVEAKQLRMVQEFVYSLVIIVPSAFYDSPTCAVLLLATTVELRSTQDHWTFRNAGWMFNHMKEKQEKSPVETTESRVSSSAGSVSTRCWDQG